MINLFRTIINDIIKWVFILTGISFLLSVISIVIRFDITDSTIPFLQIFATAMSDYGFLLGSIMMAIGLIKVFFKRPSASENHDSQNQDYIPKYRSKDPATQNRKIKEIIPPSKSIFSEQELIYFLSGLFTIGIAISIYILFLITSWLI